MGMYLLQYPLYYWYMLAVGQADGESFGDIAWANAPGWPLLAFFPFLAASAAIAQLLVQRPGERALTAAAKAIGRCAGLSDSVPPAAAKQPPTASGV